MESGHEGAGTKFYFCETCGKRVTDEETRNKKLKGVYCKNCAVGVMTVEFDAISDVPLNVQPERKKSAVAMQPAIKSNQVPTRKPVQGARVPAHKDEPTPIPAMAIVGGIAVAATVLGFALTGSSSRNSGSANPSAPVEQKKPVVEADRPASKDVSISRPPAVEAARTAEVQAKPDADPEAADYDKLVKFEGIPESNIVGRVAAVEAFLKTHSQSAFALPARGLLETLKKQTESPAAAQTSKAPQPTANPVKTATSDNSNFEDWRALFDGKSMNGWEESFGKWSVDDGAIVTTSWANNGARLGTTASFDDFELTFEIQDSGRYALLQLRNLGTSFKLMRQKDGWDSVSVKAIGSNVQCTLNGATVPISDDDGDNSGSLHGDIGFYARKGTVLKIRNIKVRRAQGKF